MSDDNLLIENVVFILLVLIIFVGLFYFVFTNGGGNVDLERNYAEKIAVGIDKSVVGMSVSYNLSKLYEKANENNFDGDVVKIDNKLKLVRVSVDGGNGYAHKFFSNYDIVWNLDDGNRHLTLEVLKNE